MAVGPVREPGRPVPGPVRDEHDELIRLLARPLESSQELDEALGETLMGLGSGMAMNGALVTGAPMPAARTSATGGCLDERR